MSHEHFDVIVVGAGLSGIGAGHFLQDRCPGRSYAILESRDAIGGTWDLFRYPGIRSDSDMYTLGYAFRPWTDAKAIADGPSILKYVRDTAREGGIDRHIRFRHKVVAANWSGSDQRWTVTAERTADDGSTQPVRYTCSFLYNCSGYYNYAAGYMPDFPGAADFKGRLVHPQKWTPDIDYAGKRVVVIGSGATAVTLVPEMAKTAASVTMLQRSPTWIISMPSKDKVANFLRRVLPAKTAYFLSRWKQVLMQLFFYRLARGSPEFVGRMLRLQVRKALGPDYDVRTHFKPRYNPWEQRLCLVPDADLFRAIRSGRAEVVTDHIERFTPGGILLKSGRELAADVVVSATGLDLLALGGATLSVDGTPVQLNQTLGYKGMMLSGVPNFAAALGYTNASWTLKCDLTCEFMCRLLNHMAKHGYTSATPVNKDPTVQALPFIDFTSGYVQRAIERFPKQGSKAPWKLYQNYARDIVALRYGKLEDGALQFAGAGR